MSDTENPADHIGLPNAADTRQVALKHLREMITLAVTQANDEAFDDLGLCLDAVKQQAKRIQVFDRALVDLMPEHARDDAYRFLRNRDAASIWGSGAANEDLPF